MKRSILSISIGAAALAFGLGACSSDTTAPGLQVSDQEIAAGIANDAGDAIATSVDLMTSDAQQDGASASLVLGSGVSGSVSGATSASVECSGPDGDGWYTCSATTWRGLDLTRMIRFWDGTSPALSFTSATDSVNHIHTLTGSYVQGWFPNRTVWVNNADTATLNVNRSGSPVQHIWDGVGVRADSTRFVSAQRTRTWHYTAYDTASAVTFDLPRSTNPWPMSGSVVHNLTVHFTAQSDTRSFDKTVARRVMVTFNGTSMVTLQVGGLTCTLDLETHQVSACTGTA